jgi:thymidylate kinase
MDRPAEPRDYPGFLVALEGPDCGLRPRALETLRNVLEAHGRDVLVTRWMDSALAGEVYRANAPLSEFSPRTLALLAACDLAERIEWEILPALRAGAVVLADWYLYRVALGSARDVDPDWLEALCGVGPVPDLALHFPVDPAQLMTKVDRSLLDLYEAGMDLGLTHDLPLSFRLHEERLLEGYAEWSERHRVPVEAMTSIEAAVARVQASLALDPAGADQRRLAVFGALRASKANPVHARQVARLARQLFTLAAPRHRLGPEQLELLEYACLLHDVGGSELGEEHPYRSARQIRESRPPAFSPAELTAMAVLVAIHRAGDQERDVDDWLAELPPDLQQTVTLLGPLLRLADALDAGRRQAIRNVEATIHDGLFDLVLRSKDKAKLEVKAAVERADLFEQAYGLHLALDVRRKGAPPAPTGLAAAATADD